MILGLRHGLIECRVGLTSGQRGNDNWRAKAHRTPELDGASQRTLYL